MDVVTVVGGHQGGLDSPRDLEQLRIGGLLLGDAVVLDLDEEVVAAEDVLQSSGLLEGALLIAVHERLQHLAAEAPTGHDQARCVLLEQFPVDLGLHVVALEEGAARQLDEVLVALGILGQCREVVVGLASTLGLTAGIIHATPAGGALGAMVVGLVELRTDDRLHAVLTGRLVEVEDAIHVAVVGDPDRGLTISRGRRHHVAHTSSTIEHRELGVQMEVGEGIGHPEGSWWISRGRWAGPERRSRGGRAGESHRCDLEADTSPRARPTLPEPPLPRPSGIP